MTTDVSRFIVVGEEAFLPDEWARIPHGRVGYSYHGCRCEVCSDARATYKRALRQRPGWRHRWAAYMRGYRQRADVKAKNAAYMRAYRANRGGA